MVILRIVFWEALIAVIKVVIPCRHVVKVNMNNVREKTPSFRLNICNYYMRSSDEMNIVHLDCIGCAGPVMEVSEKKSQENYHNFGSWPFLPLDLVE